MHFPRSKKRFWFSFAVILFFAYLVSYFVITRAGHAFAREWGMKGFYYVNPSDSNFSADWERQEQLAFIFYFPIYGIEFHLLGQGMSHGHPPLMGLSK